MKTTARTTTAIVLLAGLVSALLTGCSSGSGGEQSAGSPSTSHASDKNIELAKCMRERGHEMDDSGGGIKIGGGSGVDGAFLSDLTACQKQAGIDVPAPTTSAVDQEKELDFARCMREHGVTDYPDPGDGINPLQPYEGAHKDAFESASPTCDDEVYGGSHSGGATEVKP